MLKSINVCTYPENVPLADVFAGIKAAGFRYAELNMFSSRQTYPNLWLGADDSEIIAVRELAAEYGITPVGLVSAELWSKRLTDNDPGVRALCAYCDAWLPREKTVLLTGMMADKDAARCGHRSGGSGYG